MLYREIIAVFSDIHTKHINTVCVQNEDISIFKQALGIKASSTLSSAADQVHPSATGSVPNRNLNQSVQCLRPCYYITDRHTNKGTWGLASTQKIIVLLPKDH